MQKFTCLVSLVLTLASGALAHAGCGDFIVADCGDFNFASVFCPNLDEDGNLSGENDFFFARFKDGKTDQIELRQTGDTKGRDIYRGVINSNREIYVEAIESSNAAGELDYKYETYTVGGGRRTPVKACRKIVVE